MVPYSQSSWIGSQKRFHFTSKRNRLCGQGTAMVPYSPSSWTGSQQHKKNNCCGQCTAMVPYSPSSCTGSQQHKKNNCCGQGTAMVPYSPSSCTGSQQHKKITVAGRVLPWFHIRRLLVQGHSSLFFVKKKLLRAGYCHGYTRTLTRTIMTIVIMCL